MVRFVLQPFGSPSVIRIPMVTLPGRRLPAVNLVSPRMAASVGVFPPLSFVLLRSPSNEFVGKVV